MIDTDHAAAAVGGDSGIVLVPHTHWDREWYEPFQVFRLRLVEALCTVLDMAESDPDFAFTLDGQTAAIDDYLEIRPEDRDRVSALVARGQLALGPWHILLDEFLCAGETTIRNLELGIKRSGQLGATMRVGYLPDMFGHIAQMPQILNGFDISDACLWRGVPAHVNEHAFSWRAPNGSVVRTEYLFDGYGSALNLLAIPDRTAVAMDDYRRRTRGLYGDDPVLGMVGTDHMPPDKQLMSQVRRAHSDELPIRVKTLASYFEELGPGVPRLVVDGELRSHARANLLPGVNSIRIPLKRAMAAAERTLREAEAVTALWSTTDYNTFLRLAWRKVIESSAHDSVVGSGNDETVEQVGARLAEAQQIARAVRDDVLGSLAEQTARSAQLVVNTLPLDRTELIEMEFPVNSADAHLAVRTSDGRWVRTQTVSHSPVTLSDELMEATDLERLLARIHGRELFGQLIDHVAVEPGRVQFAVAHDPAPADFNIADLAEKLRTGAVRHPGPWRILILAQPRRTLVAEVPMRASEAVELTASEEPAVPEDEADTVTVDALHISNSRVSAEVAANGTLTIAGDDGSVLNGVGQIVDEGDRGDSYNFAPCAGGAPIGDPGAVWTTVAEAGPLRGVIEIVRDYTWPLTLADDRDERSAETALTRTFTRVELRAGEPAVRIHTEFVNHCENHRVRLHVPLPHTVEASDAFGQFAVTTRGLAAEGGAGEYPLPTYPAYSAVSVGPAHVILNHATEYEVVDGRTLALTLLRSVGSISVNVHPLRDEPAGGEIPIPGAQEKGTRVFADLCFILDSAGWQHAGIPGWIERLHAPGIARAGQGAAGAHFSASRRTLEVTGPQVQCSSIRRVGNDTEIRLVALSDNELPCNIAGDFSAVTRTDLNGRALDTTLCDGETTLTLAPWEIRTLRLER